ncbi:hypothetical protein OE165_27800, partial [Escherichia coli]|uniref:hypothetical protein n=1 Tax=Escherichia coli TaxID=562 RepID=UPI0021F3A846
LEAENLVNSETSKNLEKRFNEERAYVDRKIHLADLEAKEKAKIYDQALKEKQEQEAIYQKFESEQRAQNFESLNNGIKYSQSI